MNTSPAPAPSITENWFKKLTNRLSPFANVFAIANLVAQIGIIVTGGAVRLTGSGLGCSTWPMCEPGNFTPEFHAEMTYHPIIEFGNRTLTGVLGVIAVLLILAVAFDSKRTPRIRRLVWWPLALIALQAVVGGITVLLDLHPAIVAIHMVISVALVAISALIQYRLSPKHRDSLAQLPRIIRSGSAFLFAWMVPIVALGVIVTGAGPHSGDTEVGYRFSVDPFDMARVHAMSVWVFCVALVVGGFLLFRYSKSAIGAIPGSVRNGYWWVVAVTVLQGAIGYYQTFNDLPELVVALHLLGIGLFTTVTTRLFLLTREPVSSTL